MALALKRSGLYKRSQSSDGAVWDRKKGGGLHLPVRASSCGGFSGGYAREADFRGSLPPGLSSGAVSGICGDPPAVYVLL